MIRSMTLGVPKVQGVWCIKYLEYTTPPYIGIIAGRLAARPLKDHV